MIKVIAFDYSGVISPRLSSDEKMLHIDKTSSKYRYYLDANNKMDLGLINNKEAEDILSDISGIPSKDIWKRIYLKPKPYDEVIDIIKILKKKYKIILFSNFMAYYLRKLLAFHKLEKLFDNIIISSEFGLLKPNYDFYQILIDKSEVKKDEILFIDDKLENVTAANKFGIKAFVFTTAETLKEDLKNEGVKI